MDIIPFYSPSACPAPVKGEGTIGLFTNGFLIFMLNAEGEILEKIEPWAGQAGTRKD